MVPVQGLNLDRYRVSVLVCVSVSVSVWESEWLWNMFWFLYRRLFRFTYADTSDFFPAVFDLRIDVELDRYILSFVRVIGPGYLGQDLAVRHVQYQALT